MLPSEARALINAVRQQGGTFKRGRRNQVIVKGRGVGRKLRAVVRLNKKPVRSELSALANAVPPCPSVVRAMIDAHLSVGTGSEQAWLSTLESFGFASFADYVGWLRQIVLQSMNSSGFACEASSISSAPLKVNASFPNNFGATKSHSSSHRLSRRKLIRSPMRRRQIVARIVSSFGWSAV